MKIFGWRNDEVRIIFSTFMIVNQLIIKLKNTIVMEITKNKITEIFCIIDDFCQEYDKEIARMSICESDGRKHRNRKWTMSRSEIMTILICFHFNTFRNFKHYYLFPDFVTQKTLIL